MSETAAEPQVTKRRVTMTSIVATGTYPALDDDHNPHPQAGQPVVSVHQAVDFVRPDHLDAYVADARTKWQTVEVSDEPDAGPGGYHGATYVPEHLDLPDAGTFYAPTPGSQAEADLNAVASAAAAAAPQEG